MSILLLYNYNTDNREFEEWWEENFHDLLENPLYQNWKKDAAREAWHAALDWLRKTIPNRELERS